MNKGSTPAPDENGDAVTIRAVVESDLGAVERLDERVTGVGKSVYWRDVFERYTKRRTKQRFFLVAEPGGLVAEPGEGGAVGTEPDGNSVTGNKSGLPLLGYIVGAVRDWEFGTEPCGWIFAFSVDPDTRLQGVGELLFEAISARFKSAGVTTMRTIVARDNQLHMMFFRSEGMTAGPFIQLEKELD